MSTGKAVPGGGNSTEATKGMVFPRDAGRVNQSGGDLRLKEGTGWVGRSEPEGPTEGTEVSEQERDFPRTLAPSSHCPTPSLSPEPLGTRGHRAWWPRLCALQPPHPTPPAAMEH